MQDTRNNYFGTKKCSMTLCQAKTGKHKCWIHLHYTVGNKENHQKSSSPNLINIRLWSNDLIVTKNLNYFFHLYCENSHIYITNNNNKKKKITEWITDFKEIFLKTYEQKINTICIYIYFNVVLRTNKKHQSV